MGKDKSGSLERARQGIWEGALKWDLAGFCRDGRGGFLPCRGIKPGPDRLDQLDSQNGERRDCSYNDEGSVVWDDEGGFHPERRKSNTEIVVSAFNCGIRRDGGRSPANNKLWRLSKDCWICRK